MEKETSNESFAEHISQFIGETVTIFTTSGGASGQGFTGVVLSVNHCFVRLITQIGAAPDCALGNECFGNRNYRDNRYYEDYRNSGYPHTVGSVADIPIERIASFVHNAV